MIQPGKVTWFLSSGSQNRRAPPRNRDQLPYWFVEWDRWDSEVLNHRMDFSGLLRDRLVAGLSCGHSSENDRVFGCKNLRFPKWFMKFITSSVRGTNAGYLAVTTIFATFVWLDSSTWWVETQSFVVAYSTPSLVVLPQRMGTSAKEGSPSCICWSENWAN